MTYAADQDVAEGLHGIRPTTFAPVSSSADFETAYSENVGFVWRVLRGMGVPESQVEDAVQDVFVVVHQRLVEFDRRHPIRTWLFAIAYRVACNHRRKSRRTQAQVPLENQIQVTDHAPTPAEAAERSEALRVVFELLDQLDDEKRAVFLLSDVEGLTVPEIARATGVQINTVYTRLRRARLVLNKKFADWQRGKP